MSAADQPAGVAGSDSGAAAHPLDPLTAEEFRRVAAALRRDRATGPGWRFASIELAEPAKEQLHRMPGPGRGSSQGIRREAVAVCWNTGNGQAYRAVVSLADDTVIGWQHLPGQQPNMTVDEWHECDAMLRAHPGLIAALRRRGLTDMSRVLTDVWAYGAALVPERYQGIRIGWADVLVPRQRRRQPVRAPRHRAAPAGRPERDDPAGARGQRGRRRRRRAP